MILNDKEIIELCEQGMITPFLKDQVSKLHDRKVISYGVSSFGYDIRLNSEVKVFDRNKELELDPKDFNTNCLEVLPVYESPKGQFVLLPAYSFALGSSIETFNIPADVLCLFTCKSTYARVGLNVNNTIFEPSWNGEVALELTNPTNKAMKIYTNEGIGQVVFFKGNRPDITYADRNGKYQGQTGITTAKV